ncbi:Hypothetical predicted protein [Mytilus galloprovincialis]|uniref:Uncharacterized protein n=1 Tax=Mytilus galloprovincialis TaxID=29158 RepID=A0A8B6C6Z3_MYTGA|nr:Hypothetical predicted protein [Mytilus galloprovincialis]
MSNQNSENPDNDKMAGSYVSALKQNNNNFAKCNAEPDAEYFNIKPVFILESDIFGSSKPDKNNFLTHTELFRCIDLTIPDNHLNGLQRVIGGVWRIYPDNEEDRDTLVANTVRKKRIEVYPRNQKYVEKESPTTARIRMKNIPLSANEDQLLRYLQNWHLNVLNYHRKKLRIDGLVTNCQTGVSGRIGGGFGRGIGGGYGGRYGGRYGKGKKGLVGGGQPWCTCSLKCAPGQIKLNKNCNLAPLLPGGLNTCCSVLPWWVTNQNYGASIGGAGIIGDGDIIGDGGIIDGVSGLVGGGSGLLCPIGSICGPIGGVVTEPVSVV